MSHVGMPRWGHGHAVTWYTLDGKGIEAVARFVAEGWARSESALVVATAAHRRLIDAALVRLGERPDAMRLRGRYVTRDAHETLEQFVRDGELDPDGFRAIAGGLLDEAGRDGAHVRAFGEMVAMLWQRGELSLALELEGLWGALLRERDFSLVSAYPARPTDDARLIDVRLVCDLHTDLVVAGADDTHGTDGAGDDLRGPATSAATTPARGSTRPSRSRCLRRGTSSSRCCAPGGSARSTPTQRSSCPNWPRTP